MWTLETVYKSCALNRGGCVSKPVKKFLVPDNVDTCNISLGEECHYLILAMNKENSTQSHINYVFDRIYKPEPAAQSCVSPCILNGSGFQKKVDFNL